MNKKTLCNLLDEVGVEYRSYSGRAMYGESCVGVDLNSGFDAISTEAGLALALAQAYLSTYDVDSEDAASPDIGDVIDLFAHARSDSMGLGTIVYFPQVKWVADDAEDNSPENAK